MNNEIWTTGIKIKEYFVESSNFFSRLCSSLAKNLKILLAIRALQI